MRFFRLVSGCHPWRRALGMVLLGFMLAVVGCAGRGNVSGKVTFKNKPLRYGTVLFEGSDGGSRQGSIQEDGSFVVEDLAPGEAKVAVNSPDPKSIRVMSKGDIPPEPLPVVPGWFAIPKKYEKVATSELKYTIKSGSNTIDIELK